MDSRPCDLATPSGWREIFWRVGGKAWTTPGNLKVLASYDSIDGAEWLHISMSRRARMPEYADLCLVRRCLVPPGVSSYQVFPHLGEHVSNHDFCLHLWTPMGADPFPDLMGERMRAVGIPGLSQAQIQELIARGLL